MTLLTNRPINVENNTTEMVHFMTVTYNLTPNGQLSTRLLDKRDDFNFAIINFPHLDMLKVLCQPH